MTEVAGEPDGKRRGLLGASFVVSLGTTLSRVLGLCRDVVLANLLGAAPNADAFFVAFKIPNFLRRLFAEGAFSQAFVPVLTEVRERGSHDAAGGGAVAPAGGRLARGTLHGAPAARGA